MKRAMSSASRSFLARSFLARSFLARPLLARPSLTLALIAGLAAVGMFAAACSPSERALQQAKAEPLPATKPELPEAWLAPRDKGLPMWVVRDPDSTIYLTGTVHALPPDLVWKSPKLQAALKEASEVWLEIAMTDPADFRRRASGVIQKYAATEVPLSSRLNASEKAALAAFTQQMKMSPEAVKRLEGMKPWFVANAISSSSLAAAGFQGDSGIDWEIARMANEQGDAIKGFETVEFQVGVLSAGSDAEQMQQLRAMLLMPREVRERIFIMMTPAFIAWANGDTRPLEAFFTLIAWVSHLDRQQKQQLDRMIADRNETWAGQLEERLKGSGVTFVAVGGGHLVGPDSLQMRLKRRGILAERY